MSSNLSIEYSLNSYDQIVAKLFNYCMGIRPIFINFFH